MRCMGLKTVTSQSNTTSAMALPKKRANVMTHSNSAKGTVEINLLMQDLGEFMVAKNAGDQVDESLWRTVRPFVSCNTWNH